MEPYYKNTTKIIQATVAPTSKECPPPKCKRTQDSLPSNKREYGGDLPLLSTWKEGKESEWVYHVLSEYAPWVKKVHKESPNQGQGARVCYLTVSHHNPQQSQQSQITKYTARCHTLIWNLKACLVCHTRSNHNINTLDWKSQESQYYPPQSLLPPQSISHLRPPPGHPQGVISPTSINMLDWKSKSYPVMASVGYQLMGFTIHPHIHIHMANPFSIPQSPFLIIIQVSPHAIQPHNSSNYLTIITIPSHLMV